MRISKRIEIGVLSVLTASLGTIHGAYAQSKASAPDAAPVTVVYGNYYLGYAADYDQGYDGAIASDNPKERDQVKGLLMSSQDEQLVLATLRKMEKSPDYRMALGALKNSLNRCHLSQQQLAMADLSGKISVWFDKSVKFKKFWGRPVPSTDREVDNVEVNVAFQHVSDSSGDGKVELNNDFYGPTAEFMIISKALYPNKSDYDDFHRGNVQGYLPGLDMSVSTDQELLKAAIIQEVANTTIANVEFCSKMIKEQAISDSLDKGVADVPSSSSIGSGVSNDASAAGAI